MDAAVGTRTTLPQRIKLALVAATLMLSLGIGLTANTQQVDARRSSHCIIIQDETDWFMLTGYRADADWVGGMYCWKS